MGEFAIYKKFENCKGFIVYNLAMGQNSGFHQNRPSRPTFPGAMFFTWKIYPLFDLVLFSVIWIQFQDKMERSPPRLLLELKSHIQRRPDGLNLHPKTQNPSYNRARVPNDPLANWSSWWAWGATASCRHLSSTTIVIASCCHHLYSEPLLPN
jgi:hypothetical protein